jgi:hypothetical protein
MNLAIRISSLAAGLSAAGDGPARPMPGASHHPAGRNEWHSQARKPSRADFDGKTRPPLCHFKRPAQLRVIMMGRDNCHGTPGQRPRGPGVDHRGPGLRALGDDVVIGHSPRHLDDTDTFVFTTAINPPARGARRRAGERQAGPAPGRCAGRPPVRRGSRHPRQTSTTSPLVAALQACGLDPSFANGVLVERPDQSASGGTHAA